MFVSWIKQLAYLSIFLTIILLILPNGKIGIYIKSIFAIVVFSFVLQPLIILKNDEFDFSGFYNENLEEENSYQDNYLAMIFENKNQNNIEVVKKLLSEYGFNDSAVKLEYCIEDGNYKITQCSIQIKEYIDKDKHKDIIERIKEDVSLTLTMKKADIWFIYG